MSLDSEAKQILDRRLASGEISKEAYLDLLETLNAAARVSGRPNDTEQPGSPNTRHATKRTNTRRIPSVVRWVAGGIVLLFLYMLILGTGKLAGFTGRALVEPAESQRSEPAAAGGNYFDRFDQQPERKASTPSVWNEFDRRNKEQEGKD